jgi:hypothetical protein
MNLKNVAAFLFVWACLVFIAVFVYMNWFGTRQTGAIGSWMNRDDGNIVDVEVLPKSIDVTVAAQNSMHVRLEGRWDGTAFLCDTHLDSPPEVAVAEEQQNGDLVIDMSYFIPDDHRKIKCQSLYPRHDFPAAGSQDHSSRTWGEWLFDQVFGK